MNKAIQILSEWVSDNERYIKVMTERRDREKYWSLFGDNTDYYKPKYQETKAKVATLKRELDECKQALILLGLPQATDPTEPPSETVADTGL